MIDMKLRNRLMELRNEVPSHKDLHQHIQGVIGFLDEVERIGMNDDAWCNIEEGIFHAIDLIELNLKRS